MVVVKQSGDVMLYDIYGNYKRVISTNATSAKFIEEGILVEKENGENVIADVNEFCVTV